jgi:hypothetical protein
VSEVARDGARDAILANIAGQRLAGNFMDGDSRGYGGMNAVAAMQKHLPLGVWCDRRVQLREAYTHTSLPRRGISKAPKSGWPSLSIAVSSAIQDEASSAASFREGACETRIARCEVVAVAAVEGDVVTIFMDLDAVAVELHFMRPAEPVRRLFAERREAGLDEA